MNRIRRVGAWLLLKLADGIVWLARKVAPPK
jgi:hypothetical protein